MCTDLIERGFIQFSPQIIKDHYRMTFLSSGFFKNRKYYRFKPFKINPAEPSMNMLANQSKCDRNLQISCSFWWIFFILCRFYSFYAFLCIK